MKRRKFIKILASMLGIGVAGKAVSEPLKNKSRSGQTWNHKANFSSLYGRFGNDVRFMGVDQATGKANTAMALVRNGKIIDSKMARKIDQQAYNIFVRQRLDNVKLSSSVP